MTIRSAYFEKFDFGAAPNLLLWGSNAEMTRLCGFLRRAAAGSADQVALNTISEPVDGKLVTVRKAQFSIGLVKAPDGFDWILDVETLNGFADLVEALSNANRPGHQYLETAMHGQIAVRVSCDEYPDEFRPDASGNSN